jgi:hypothetical protein
MHIEKSYDLTLKYDHKEKRLINSTAFDSKMVMD